METNMNILYVAHETVLGGATLSLLGMIDELKKNNKVYVLVRTDEGPLINELEKRKVTIIYTKFYSWLIPKEVKGMRGKLIIMMHRVACIINYLKALCLRKKIRNFHIDIIHTNSSIINMGGILSKMYNIPHVWHIREFGKEDFNLSFVFSESYSYRYIEKHSDKVICVSDELKRKYLQFIPENKVLRIYNGIRFPEKKIKTFEKKDRYNLLIAGRLSDAKGQKEAMLAISYLKKKGINNIFLHLAGSGNIEIYKAEAIKLGIESQVTFYGHINNLNQLRRIMDIELVCSKMEAFGRVTIEAMASCLPVIGANSGGTKEIINNEINGLLYTQGDFKNLAMKIEALVEDEEYRKRIAMKALEYVHHNFSVEKNANQVYQCYLNIGGESGKFKNK